MHYNFNLFYMSYVDDEEIKIDIGEEGEEEDSDDTFGSIFEEEEIIEDDIDEESDDFLEEDELKGIGIDDTEL